MAEKEYIERDAVLEDIDSAMTNKGLGYVVVQLMKRYIKRQPAADVVEVVRCRDCRHFVREFDLVGHCNYCGIHLDHMESGYCSYGERREQG